MSSLRGFPAKYSHDAIAVVEILLWRKKLNQARSPAQGEEDVVECGRKLPAVGSFPTSCEIDKVKLGHLLWMRRIDCVRCERVCPMHQLTELIELSPLRCDCRHSTPVQSMIPWQTVPSERCAISLNRQLARNRSPGDLGPGGIRQTLPETQ